ncbi:MAG TPA: magnesium/cobalt transporter CorA [Candidatus Nanoarchaeia archaeon]|nr:magnesium/cobalt transporter CorA [Candidatus Nanoarchaeia archaeon]
MLEVIYLDGGIRISNSLSYFNPKLKTWVDVTNPSREELRKIKEFFNLHKNTIDDCSLVGNRPKVSQIGDYTLIIFYALSKEFNMHEVCFVFGRNFLLSFHKDKIDGFEKIKSNREKLKDSMGLGIDFVLHELIEKINENYFSVLENLEYKLDDLENKALKNPEPAVLEELFKTKRKLLKVRKVIYPQREAINNLYVTSYKNLSKDSMSYFRDIHDDLLIITDLVEDFRETISSILEVHLSVTSNKLNEIMKVLTIFATVLMPLTLIASIYGMNFDFMPELKWRYGYFYILGFMVFVLVITVLFLKKKKWL